VQEYHKIQTVWLRDPETRHKTLLENQWAKPEFEYLANSQWVMTEKVDGTNIRIDLTPATQLLGGRTDRAQIPAHLVNAIDGMEIWQKWFAKELPPMTLYGEGYGAKIQKGGGNYRPDQSFVLFDIRIGDAWLEQENVADIAQQLDLDIVPTLAIGNLYGMINLVQSGMKSKWGDFISEGVVARPVCELQNRLGERVITKLKHKDFPR